MQTLMCTKDIIIQNQNKIVWEETKHNLHNFYLFIDATIVFSTLFIYLGEEQSLLANKNMIQNWNMNFYIKIHNKTLYITKLGNALPNLSQLKLFIYIIHEKIKSEKELHNDIPIELITLNQLNQFDACIMFGVCFCRKNAKVFVRMPIP